MSYETLSTLDNKTVVITGGSGQVGSETAKLLASKGARVILITRKPVTEITELLSQLPNQQLNHLALTASVTDSASIKLAVEQVKATTNKIDILINAAGYTRNVMPENLSALTDEMFDQIVGTNLRGTFIVIREFYELLKASGDAVVVNLSSTAGMRASKSNLAYGASKAGIDLITKTLGKNLAPTIRVVGVAPGYLENPTSGAVKPAGTNERLSEQSPLKRVGSGTDIANAIKSVIMDMRFVTGQTVLVDGGISL